MEAGEPLAAVEQHLRGQNTVLDARFVAYGELMPFQITRQVLPVGREASIDEAHMDARLLPVPLIPGLPKAVADLGPAARMSDKGGSQPRRDPLGGVDEKVDV